MKAIFRNGQWQDGDGNPINPPDKLDLSRPLRMFASSEYEGYECPVTGKWVEGKHAHRENLKRTGCRLLERGEFEDVKKNGKRRQMEAIDAGIEKSIEAVAKDFL